MSDSKPDRKPKAIKNYLQSKYPAHPQKTAYLAMLEHTGLWHPYEAPPSPELIAKTQRLFDLLSYYDELPTNKLANKIKALTDEMNISAYSFPEFPNAIYFYPNVTEGKSLEFTINFLWNIGKVQVPGDETTYNNPYFPALLSNEHGNKDGVDRLAARLIFGSSLDPENPITLPTPFATFKVMLVNAIFPNQNPTRVSNEQPSHSYADVAHSKGMLYYNAAEYLFNKVFDQKLAIVNLHGMGDKGRMEILAVSNENREPKNARRVFLQLFAAAFTKELVEFKEGAGSVTLGTEMPGFVNDNVGDKIPMTVVIDGDPGMFHYDETVHSSNVIGNIPRSNGKPEQALHIEASPGYKSTMLNKKGAAIISALNKAMFFFTRYNDNIAEYNLWNLNNTNPEVYQDMSKYQDLYGFNFNKSDSLLFSAAASALSDNDSREEDIVDLQGVEENKESKTKCELGYK